jgi:hypothetical protein
MFDTVYTSVFPLIKTKYADKVQIIFRQQIQPWHPSSTLVHEAGVAVLKLSPSKFWDFSKALFADQESYFDGNVVNEKRNDTYQRLAKLGGSVGVDEGEIFKLLKIGEGRAADGSLNSGNGVTNDLKASPSSTLRVPSMLYTSKENLEMKMNPHFRATWVEII